jgi:hypothetical protein
VAKSVVNDYNVRVLAVRWQFQDRKQQKLTNIKLSRNISEKPNLATDGKHLLSFSCGYLKLNFMQKELLNLSIKVGKELEKTAKKLNLDDYQKDNLDESIMAVFNTEISTQKTKTEEIIYLLNELHNDLAKSIIEMEIYKPLSSDLLVVKEKIRLLND